MKIVELHDRINPDRIVPFNAEQFLVALPYNGGSLLTLTDTQPVYVKETPEEIVALLKEAEAT